MREEILVEFVRGHAADDIVYALKDPQYFGLSDVDYGKLHAYIFSLLNAAKETL